MCQVTQLNAMGVCEVILGKIEFLRPLARDKEYERHRNRDPKLAMSKRLRNSARYQKFRKWFRARHPLCCDPQRRHSGRQMAALDAIEERA